MTKIRKILLIGRSGGGKSALANVLTSRREVDRKKVTKELVESNEKCHKCKQRFAEGKNKEGEDNKWIKATIEEQYSYLFHEECFNFKESAASVSETKRIQFEEFIDKENRYLVIDTPGIGDTELKDNEVLNIIAKAVYLVRDGVNQILFVVGSKRFDQYEMATYNLLRTIIFDENITEHTTIVRTHFADFRSKEEREKDINSMKTGSQAKKFELKEKIAIKEKELESLSPNSEQYQKILVEFEQLKKELRSTLAEIIESCPRVIHVDNPLVNIKELEDLKTNINLRTRSRRKLLTHLSSEDCQGAYGPPKLKKFREEIAGDYYEKILIEKNEEKLNIKNEKQIRLFSVDAEDSETIEIKNKKLESKRARLKKKSEGKERVIRQKILKHIFNNYVEINKELGGNIFLSSVTGDYDWSKINSGFSSKKLMMKWLSQGFDYYQTQEWAITLGNSFNPKYDINFCTWLRDDKKLVVEEVSKYEIGKLKKEYSQKLVKETNSSQLLSISDQCRSKPKDAQEWLDENFPLEQRENINHLDISFKNLSGSLKLEGFFNLTEFNCSHNQLTELDFSDCAKLAELSCSNNFLTNLNYATLDPTNLIYLNLINNNLSEQNLSSFSYFTKLEELWIGNGNVWDKIEKNVYNRFFGSLEPLKNLTNLKILYISNTDINNGVNYLPSGLKTIYSSTRARPEAKVKELFESLISLGFELFDKSGGEYVRQEKKDFCNAQEWLDENYPLNNREKLTRLNISGQRLTGSLKLTKFSNLKKLDCSKNQLTSLDLQDCKKLTRFYCSDNLLTNLNINSCLELKEFWCVNNQITNLNISNCNELAKLACHNNQLTSLDVSNCKQLDAFSCNDNQITNLDINNLTNLKELYCGGNNLISLDVSKCSQLNILNCRGNQLTELDLSGCEQLNYLYCINNLLTNLNISCNSQLTSLTCYGNFLIDLDLAVLKYSKNAQEWLEKTYLSKEKLTILDISCEGLTGSLNLNGLENCTEVNCSENSLTNLIIENCLQLKKINCSMNQLTSLIIINCPELADLDCSDNLLTSFDFATLNPEKLTTLWINDNNFSSQNLSCLRSLISLDTLTIGNEARRIKQGFYNRFFGNLKFLKNLTELNGLEITNTWVECDLENFPDNLGYIVVKKNCDYLAEAKANEIAKILKDYERKESPGIYDFQAWKNTISAQEYFNQKYSLNQRENINNLFLWDEKLGGTLHLVSLTNCIKIDCSDNKLVNLVIENCPQLEEIDCSDNRLTNLQIINCPQLSKLNCSDNALPELNCQGLTNLSELNCSNNWLTSTDFIQVLNPEKLTDLRVDNNNFPAQDLSFLQFLTNLKILYLGNDVSKRISWDTYNRFIGSLEPLKSMSDLRHLHISNTDIDSGYKYLPGSIENIDYSIEVRPDSGLKNIVAELMIRSIEKKNSDKLPFLSAQEWLDKSYPEKITVQIIDLSILAYKDKEEGELIISDFPNLIEIKKGWKDIYKVTKVSIINCPCLEKININWFKDNKELQLSKLPQLREIECHNNQLTSCDISICPNLTRFICSRNQLLNLNLNNNPQLKRLDCYHNRFTNLDCSNCSQLEELDFSNNFLTKIDLGSNKKLVKLDCSYNRLTNLDVNDNSYLKELCCSRNKLTRLDLSKCINLTELCCNFNQLTELNLTNLNQLEILNCNDNYLINLNFSSLNPNKLTNLNISDNNFPEQDLMVFSNFVNLKSLWIGNGDREKIKKEICNRFYGSLQPLENVNNLNSLNITNTNLNSDLKYLPVSLREIHCDSLEVFNSRQLARELSSYVLKEVTATDYGYNEQDYKEKVYDYQTWRRNKDLEKSKKVWIQKINDLKWNLGVAPELLSEGIEWENKLNSKEETTELEEYATEILRNVYQIANKGMPVDLQKLETKIEIIPKL